MATVTFYITRKFLSDGSAVYAVECDKLVIDAVSEESALEMADAMVAAVKASSNVEAEALPKY